MTRLKDMMKNGPVHERRIEMSTRPLGDGRIIVEGRLRDERHATGYHWDGRERIPGTVHWIIARLLIGNWPPTILDAEAEMNRVPHELCDTTLDSIRKIVGIKIVSGYSDEIRRILGGIEGCTHLTHLLVTMGPAALHGLWTHLSEQPRPLPDKLEDVPGLSYLVNSCMLWREDGPLIEEIKRVLEEKKPRE